QPSPPSPPPGSLRSPPLHIVESGTGGEANESERACHPERRRREGPASAKNLPLEGATTFPKPRACAQGQSRLGTNRGFRRPRRRARAGGAVAGFPLESS